MLLLECKENLNISKLTSFKIGGEISRVYYPETVDEFIEVLKKEPNAFVAGNLSNVLVSSDGFDGALVLTKKLDKISIEGNVVTAGAGVRGTKLSKLVLEKGLSGLEFMVAFPGSVGGEVFMNAGAHGQTIADVLRTATLYSLDEGVVTLSNKEMDFSYRTSVCQKKSYFVLEAEFLLESKSKEFIQGKMDENLQFRLNKQPSLTLPNCGSVFRNPTGDSAGRLLELCGAKEISSGDVKVWEGHANFIINYGQGTSLDVLTVMAEMKKRVKENFKIELRPEVRFLGGKNKKEVELCKMLYQM